MFNVFFLNVSQGILVFTKCCLRECKEIYAGLQNCVLVLVFLLRVLNVDVFVFH